MADPGILPPLLNPTSQNTDAYFDMLRKQQLAQALMQGFQQSNQTPPEWNSMRVVPRRSPLSTVATLVSALMAGKSQQGALEAEKNYFLAQNKPNTAAATQGAASDAQSGATPSITATLASALSGNAQSGQSTSSPTGILPSPGKSVPIAAPADPQDPAMGLAVRPPSSAAARAQNPTIPSVNLPQQDPRLIPGTDAQTSQFILNLTGPAEYGKVLAGQYAPTDLEKTLRAAGINNPMLRSQILQANIAKQNYIPNESLRQGTGSWNPVTQQFDAYNPVTPPGSVPTFNGGQPTGVSALPGSVNAVEQADAAAARGKAAGTPTIVTGSSGAPIATFPAAGAIGGAQAPKVARPSFAPPLNPPPGNHIMSPTEAKANEGLATQAVADFQALNEKGSAAVAGMRNLSEMKNLLQGFNPGKAAGALSAMGNVAISLGMDPQQVANLTNVDPGNVEAFEKNTAALASQVVKEFTNRTTQMEFNTFMANNPNPFMTANGLKRVIDFMEKGLNSTIDQQQEAQQFWRANQSRPERFVTDFPAYYNAKKAGQIKAGQFDSLNPSLSSIRTRSDVNAAAAQQGTLKVMPGMDIEALKKAHPAGTVFEFPDGSRGKL